MLCVSSLLQGRNVRLFRLSVHSQMSECVTVFLNSSLNITLTKGFVCVHSGCNSSSGDTVTVSVEYAHLLFLALVRLLSGGVTSAKTITV
jgi:hypothetical protein